MELGVYTQASVAAGWIARSFLADGTYLCLIQDLPVGLCMGQDDHQWHGVAAARPLRPHQGGLPQARAGTLGADSSLQSGQGRRGPVGDWHADREGRGAQERQG